MSASSASGGARGISIRFASVSGPDSISTRALDMLSTLPWRRSQGVAGQAEARLSLHFGLWSAFQGKRHVESLTNTCPEMPVHPIFSSTTTDVTLSGSYARLVLHSSLSNEPTEASGGGAGAEPHDRLDGHVPHAPRGPRRGRAPCGIPVSKPHTDSIVYTVSAQRRAVRSTASVRSV